MNILSKKSYSLVSILALALLVSLAIFSKQVIAAPPDVPPGLSKAIEVQEANTPSLMSNSNVVGTAVGLGEDGEPIIKVYTIEDDTRRGIPRSLGGISVSVITTGKIYALKAAACQDRDGDGYYKQTGKCTNPSEYDCDDNDPAINPGESEECGDLVDNNCDGQIDENCGSLDPTPTPTPTPDPDPTPTPTPTPDIGPITSPDCDPPYKWCGRPVRIGVSVGHPNITAGTIGCRVKDNQNNYYILSNNHVMAESNKANIGDPILQPGDYDGGSFPADVIGTLEDYEQIRFCKGRLLRNCPDNTMDAAIAATSIYDVSNNTPSNGYGIPQSSTVSPSVGMSVMKYGRTTELQSGQISAINGTFAIDYGQGKIANFVGQIVITPGSFSAGGDSGSLIVVNDNGGLDDLKPVGLLFAGSTTITIANPIGPILTKFGVEVDGQ